MSDTLARIRALFEAHFERPLPEFGRATTALDIVGWDSIAHLTLLMQVESAFGIMFSAEEMGEFEDIGGIADAVDAKLAVTQP